MSYSVVAVMLTPSVVQEAFVDVYIQEKTPYYVCLRVVNRTCHKDSYNFVYFG